MSRANILLIGTAIVLLLTALLLALRHELFGALYELLKLLYEPKGPDKSRFVDPSIATIALGLAALGWLLKLYNTIAKVQKRKEKAPHVWQTVAEVASSAASSLVATAASASFVTLSASAVLNKETYISEFVQNVSQASELLSVSGGDYYDQRTVMIGEITEAVADQIADVARTTTGISSQLGRASAERTRIENGIRELQDDMVGIHSSPGQMVFYREIQNAVDAANDEKRSLMAGELQRIIWKHFRGLVGHYERERPLYILVTDRPFAADDVAIAILPPDNRVVAPGPPAP